MRSKRRRELACPERWGGCEQSEQTEGLYRSCSCFRQPLSQSALRRIASSPAGEPFGCDTICQDIRVNAQVGTRSPYSLPFVILPVPARSPFRFIRHRRRSTPNLAASPTGRARLESPFRAGPSYKLVKRTKRLPFTGSCRTK